MRLLPLVFFVAAVCAQEIPRHPRELKFPPYPFTPPRAADFRHQLASGAIAYLVEDHQLPLVNISVLVRTGSYLEPAGKRGLASLTGSEIRSGGTKSKSAADFDEEAAFLAAQISSSIGPTQGNAQLNCLTRNLDACLALFADMLRNPGFAEDRFLLAKSQMLQALERRNDRADAIEAREFQRLLRGESHFSTAQVTRASLEAITRQDLIDFHARYYAPVNFILAVSGDFQSRDMLARLEKAFAGWPGAAGAIPPVPKPEFSPRPGIYMFQKSDLNQGRVRMGHLGVTVSNPDHIALRIMNGALGGSGFTSRLTMRVRSDEGLAYQASSSFAPGTDYDGAFEVIFQSRNPSVAQAVSIVKEEIERLRNQKLTADELETQKRFTIDSFPRRFQTASLRAAQFAGDEYDHLPPDYWEKYRDRIRALTADDIQRVARQYLHPDRLVIVIVGNTEAIVKGNADRPQYSFDKLGLGAVRPMPLPDPLTMVYPSQPR
ncbi:MAG: insulinase family protein [Acidobacteria bacterium]|nr:insulinase family protein [Acidobacteriota bacterium]